MSSSNLDGEGQRAPVSDQRQAKRQRLLEAAAGEFARWGFERANINTISEQAGFGKGTVYLYTASKEQLFRDVLEEIGRQTSSVLDRSLAESAGHPPEQRLHDLVNAFSDLAIDHPDFIRLQASALFGVNRQFQEVCAGVLRGIAGTLADTFQAEEAAGQIRPVSPNALAMLLLGTLQLLALLPEALGSNTIDAATWRGVVNDVLWHGLRPQEGDRQ